MELIDRTTFIADAKKFDEDTEAAKMEIIDPATTQKMEKKNKLWSTMTKNRSKQRSRTV